MPTADELRGSNASSLAECEDAEWALTYLFQMHRAGRLEEYFALREAQEQAS
jgi:hypothetical protein